MRGNRERWTSRPLAGSGLALLLVALSACRIGPTYKVPSAPSAPAFKEQPPPEFKEAGDWQPAQPSDGLLKGKWWELYNDPVLNAMEEQVGISNQNLLQAEAQYREARSAVLTARSALFPTAGASPSISESRTGTIAKTVTPNGKSELVSGGTNTQYTLPLTASWEPDLWGSIRRGMTAAAATAQASAAELENLRLLYQSELAQDYFQLHGTDSDVDLLERTAKSYEEYVVLTRNRFAGGIASDLDVAQAEAQLYATQAQMQDLGVARAQLEPAIAVLTAIGPVHLERQRYPGVLRAALADTVRGYSKRSFVQDKGDCSKEGVSFLRIPSVLALFSGFSATLEIKAWSRALIATPPAGQMALHGLRQAGVQQYHTPSLLQSLKISLYATGVKNGQNRENGKASRSINLMSIH